MKTAWHGPGDVSPVGHAANATLDLVSYNFGIQEYSAVSTSRAKAIFQGCPEMKDGYLWVSEKPGWGIEIDEKEAAKAPFTESPAEWRLGRDSQARWDGAEAIAFGSEMRNRRFAKREANGNSDAELGRSDKRRFDLRRTAGSL